jgi:hypothetical protein
MEYLRQKTVAGPMEALLDKLLLPLLKKASFV